MFANENSPLIKEESFDNLPLLADYQFGDDDTSFDSLFGPVQSRGYEAK